MAIFDPAWVLAFATVALVVFTAVLAWVTWRLVEATRGLAKLEKQRARRAKLERKVRLAEAVIGIRADAFRDAIKGGSLPSYSAEFRGPATSPEPEDEVAPEHIAHISQTLDNAARGTASPPDSSALVLDKLRTLQDRLAAQLPRWRDEARAA